MGVFAPFSRRASEWEPKALELRRRVPVGHDALLDPWVLAPKVGLEVIDANEVLPLLADEERIHLLGFASDRWSGGVLPSVLPNGNRICMLNPRHSRTRNKITLMEEVCHVYLQHNPTSMVFGEGGLQVRDFNKRQEDEAYGVGAAALLPWRAFFSCLNEGMSATEIAARFDVSIPLVEYRIKICGATNLYRARQRQSV